MQKEKRGKHYAIGVISSLFILVLIGASAPVIGAAEKPYPNRPINVIVGFSPGGASDLGSKVMANKISEVIGQPLISNYKVGGNGTLAASYVAKAKPDGYTVLVMVSFMVLPPEIKKLDFTLDDFILTGNFGITPNFLGVKADSPWKSLKDFVEEAKRSPGRLTSATTAPYTSGHFAYSLFSKYAGVKLAAVPYKSCGDAMTALLGGHGDCYFCVGTGAISESSLVRPLATAEPKRMQGWPQIPTFTEL